MKPRMKLRLAAATALALIALPALTLTALAEGEAPMDHSGHAMAGAEGQSPATEAYIAANAAMHSEMAIEYSGNADIDFIRGMIPHHQGAVAMAQVVLEHGSDPEVRKLAEGIIAAQEAEIAFMQDWLARNAK